MKSTLRNILILIVTGVLATPTLLFAGKESGIMQEFRALEEALRSKRFTDEQRQKTVEENLLRAFRLSISRRFYMDKDQYLKDLTPAAIVYDNPTSPTVYYCKYKSFMVRYEFARDPSLFIQSPVDEKFLIREEENVDIHKEPSSTTTAPAAGQPAGGTSSKP